MVVAEKVSEVAAIPAVRTFAVQQQKYMGKKNGIVMDGRDIGTTVFPNAELKIFMTADMLIRVERRFLEMQFKNPNVTFKEVQSNLQMRDQIDSTREVSPLKMAEDAILLDNSKLTMEQQLDFALQLIQEKL
jgi:cytidylate kinase